MHPVYSSITILLALHLKWKNHPFENEGLTNDDNQLSNLQQAGRWMCVEFPSTISNFVFFLHLFSSYPNQAINIITIKERKRMHLGKKKLVVKNKDQPPQKLLFPFHLKSPNHPRFVLTPRNSPIRISASLCLRRWFVENTCYVPSMILAVNYRPSLSPSPFSSPPKVEHHWMKKKEKHDMKKGKSIDENRISLANIWSKTHQQFWVVVCVYAVDHM